jgi:hypothetical protein
MVHSVFVPSARWVRTPTAPVHRVSYCFGNTNAIYQGSPVIPLAAGVIDIVGAAAGGTVGLLGVFWGCEYVSSTTGEKVFSNYWPGSGADSNFPVKAFVYDDPNAAVRDCDVQRRGSTSTLKQRFVPLSLQRKLCRRRLLVRRPLVCRPQRLT